MPLSQNMFTKSSDAAAENPNLETERLTAIELAPRVVSRFSDGVTNAASMEAEYVSKDVAFVENAAADAYIATAPSAAEAAQTGGYATVRPGAKADATKGDAVRLAPNQEMGFLPYSHHSEGSMAQSGAHVEASVVGSLGAGGKQAANVLNGSAGKSVPRVQPSMSGVQLIQQLNSWGAVRPHGAADGNLLTSMQLNESAQSDGRPASSSDHLNQTILPNLPGNHIERTGETGGLPGVGVEAAAGAVASNFIAQTRIPAFHSDWVPPYHNHGVFVTTKLLPYAPHSYPSTAGYTAGSAYGYSPSALNGPLLSSMQASNQFVGPSPVMANPPLLGPHPVSSDAAVPISSRNVIMHPPHVHQTMIHGQELSAQVSNGVHDVQQSRHVLQSVQNQPFHNSCALSAWTNNEEGSGCRDTPSKSAVNSELPVLSKKDLRRYDTVMAPVRLQPAGGEPMISAVQGPEYGLSTSNSRAKHMLPASDLKKIPGKAAPSVVKASTFPKKGSRGVVKPKRAARSVRGDKVKGAIVSSQRQYSPLSRNKSVAATNTIGSESHEVLEASKIRKDSVRESVASHSSVKPASRSCIIRRKRPEDVRAKGSAQGPYTESDGAAQQAGRSHDKSPVGSCPTALGLTNTANPAVRDVTNMPLRSVPMPHRDEAVHNVESAEVEERSNQRDIGPFTECRENNSVAHNRARERTPDDGHDLSISPQRPFARRRRANPASRYSHESGDQQQAVLVAETGDNRNLTTRRGLRNDGHGGVVDCSRFANDLKRGLGDRSQEQPFASRNKGQDQTLTMFVPVESEGIGGERFSSALPAETVDATFVLADSAKLETSNGNLQRQMHDAVDLEIASMRSLAPSTAANLSANISNPTRSTLNEALPRVSARKVQTSTASGLRASRSSYLKSDAVAKPCNLLRSANSDTQKHSERKLPIRSSSEACAEEVMKGESMTKLKSNSLPKMPKALSKGERRVKLGNKKRQKADIRTQTSRASSRVDRRNISVAGARTEERPIISKLSKPTASIARHGINDNAVETLPKRTRTQPILRLHVQENATMTNSRSDAVTTKQSIRDNICRVHCENGQLRALDDHVKNSDLNQMPAKPPSSSFSVPVKLRIRATNKSCKQRPSSVSAPKIPAGTKLGKSSKKESAGKPECSSRAQRNSKRKNDPSASTLMRGKKRGLERDSSEVLGTKDNHDGVVCGNSHNNVTENSSQRRETRFRESHRDRKRPRVNTESSVSVPSPVEITNVAVADQGHSRTHPRPAGISTLETSLKKSFVRQPSSARVGNTPEGLFISKKRLSSRFISQRDPKKPRLIPVSVFLNLRQQLRCGLCQQDIGIDERAEHPLFPIRSLNICRTCYGTVCNKYEEKREWVQEQKNQLFIAVVEEMIRCLRPSERKAASVEGFHNAILAEDFHEILRRAKSHPVPYEMLGVMRALFRCVGISFNSGKLVMPDYVLALPSGDDIRSIIIEAIPRSLSDLESGTTAGQRLWTAVFGDDLISEANTAACVIVQRIFGLVDIRTRHIGVCEWSVDCPQTTCNIKLDEGDLNQVCSRGAASTVGIRQVFPAGPKKGLCISEGYENEKFSDDVIFGGADESCCICTKAHNTTKFPFEFMKCSDCSRKFCSICLTNVLGSMEYIRASSDESYCCLICRMRLHTVSRIKSQDTSRTPNQNRGDAKGRGRLRGSLRNNTLPLLLLSISIRRRLQGAEVDERDVGFAKLCESLNNQQMSHLQGKRTLGITDKCCLGCRLPIKPGYAEETGIVSRSRRASISEQTFLKCTERNCPVVMHKDCHSIRKPTKTRGAFSGMLCPRHKCLVCQGKGEAKLTRCRTCPSTFCREHIPRPCDVHIFSEKLIACADCKANLHLPQMSIQRPPTSSRIGDGQVGNDFAKSIALSQRQKQVAIENEVAELEKAGGS